MALCLLLVAVMPVHAIYPDDHWQYSTQITDESQFQSHIQSEIDAGRTLFVRWIASPG